MFLGHFGFRARTRVAVTREREPRYYHGAWEALPAPAESPLKESVFYFPFHLLKQLLSRKAFGLWNLEE